MNVFNLQSICQALGVDFIDLDGDYFHPRIRLWQASIERLVTTLCPYGPRQRAGFFQGVIHRAVLIAEQAGIQALLTRPLDEDARRFYLGYSFMPSPVWEDQLLLLLKDTRRFIRVTG